MIYITKRFSWFGGSTQENPVDIYKKFGLDVLMEISEIPKIKKLKSEIDKEKMIGYVPRIDLSLLSPEKVTGGKTLVLGTVYDGPDIKTSMGGALLYNPELKRVIIGFGYGTPNFSDRSAFKKGLLKEYERIAKDLDKTLTRKDKDGVFKKLFEYQDLVISEIKKRL